MKKKNLFGEVISGIVFLLDQLVIRLEVKNFNKYLDPFDELISFKTRFSKYTDQLLNF